MEKRCLQGQDLTCCFRSTMAQPTILQFNANVMRQVTEKAILAFVARALERVNLDAVLTGNAGAALHGLRVTMIALDFLIRRTPANVRKFEALAIDIDGVLFRSWYPTRGLYQVSRNLDLLQLNFTTAARKSFGCGYFGTTDKSSEMSCLHG